MNKDKVCGKCRWWIALRHVRTEKFSRLNREAKENNNEGSCRRKSPTLVDRSALSVWPFTEIDEWCGEWTQINPTPRKQGEEVTPATPNNPPGDEIFPI